MITLNNGDTWATFRASLNTNFGDCLDLNNNLSDLANAATARQNIGLGGLAILNYENPPQGYMVNGRIDVTVASSDLTVAIKTLSGNNPSTSEPVYVRIGDSVRSITSALSVTRNDGTNWFNSGSAELATLEVDYFVYLGYNATDGVVIGFSRIPFARRYGDFSATTTNERHCAISTITNATSTDYYENIGRFAATLSAGAGYTWAVPTFTALNLIQRPTYETRLLTYAPTIVWYSANPTSTYYRYKIVGNTLYVKVREGTNGTSNATSTTYTMPFTENNSQRWTAPTVVVDNGASVTNPWLARVAASVNVISMFTNYGEAAWTAANGKRIADCNLYMEL